MGILLNSVSINKSKSPVTITSALAATAVPKITVSSKSRSWGVESGRDKAMPQPHVQSPTHLTQ